MQPRRVTKPANSANHLFARSPEYSRVSPAERVLVALLPAPRNWQMVKSQGWYWIPCKSAPPSNYEHIAFYFGSPKFGADAYQIAWMARVANYRTVLRRDLFPSEPFHPRADLPYLKINLGILQPLPQPIISRRQRFLVFFATTLRKLQSARELNDLWHESPLEDEMWRGLRAGNIEAEGQWRLKIAKRNYCLDFAVFCARGNLNIECDGDTYHANPEKSRDDNQRNNALTHHGWSVLRFNTHQIVHEMADCLGEVRGTISEHGGVQLWDGGVSFPATGEEGAQQMSLF